MDSVIQIVVLCLLCTPLILLIRGTTPALALSLSLGLCVCVLLVLARRMGELSELLAQLCSEGGLDETSFAPLIKAVALAVLCRLSAEICRDGGQSSLASLVEMAGSLGILLLSVPIIYEVMELLVSLL